jgi:predicted dehydrogenase
MGRRDFSKFAPDKLDWKRWLGSARQQPLAPEKFYLWRWYWDFGGGALTDLMTHWIDVIQWYMNTPAPLQVAASGNRHQMTWDCPDTISCFLDYPKNYSVNYTGAMTSRIDDGGIEFRGTQGTLKIDRARLAVYLEKDKNANGTLLPEPETLIRSKEDGTIPHVKNFLDCVRSRGMPTANIRVAHEAARASHLGNLAFKRQRPVKWNDARQKVEV